MRLIVLPLVLMLATATFSQELPNAPSTTQQQPQIQPLITYLDGKPAGFWTFRKSWKDEPLRTNKQVLTSKTFLILNGLFAASVIIDVEYTHGKRESRGSEYPVIPAIIGMDYVMDRFFTRAYSIEAPIYGMQHYIRDAFKGQ